MAEQYTDTRTTDNRFTPSYRYKYWREGYNPISRTNFTQVMSEGTGYARTSLGGVYKSITSVRGGSFKPGEFRVNPCVITSQISGPTAVPALNIQWVNNTPYANTTHHYELADEWSFYRQRSPLTWGISSPFGSVNTSNLVDRSLQVAYSNLKAGDYDLGTDLAEMRETLEMLRSPFNALRKLLSDWQRKAGSLKKTGDAIAGTWMEYRYGIMPIVYSIQDIIALCEKQAEQVQILRRVKGSASNSKSSSTTWLTPYKSSLWSMTEGTTYEAEQKATTSVYFRRQRTPSLAHNLGLDWSNLPSIAWELTKLSWLLDWWLHIGDYLSSVRYDPSILVVGNCTSIVETIRRKSVVKDVSIGTVKIPSELLTYVQTWKRLTRVVGTPKPLYPVVDWEFHSVKHTLDALALSWQSMPKIIKKGRKL